MTTINGWVKALDLELGGRVAIFPLGSQGMAFQGELVDILFDDDDRPFAISLRKNADDPVNTVPWSSILMIARDTTPEVPAPEVDLASLVEFADKNGLEVPAVVRSAASE